jgi:hypothetical protein
MERWASITLRSVAITLVAGLTVVVSLLLLVLGQCAANGFGGKNPRELGPYLIVIGMVLAGGVALSARIARGMRADADDPGNQPAPGRRALHRLLYLIGVQIVLTAAVTCLDYLQFWPGSSPNPPRDWGQFLFIYLAAREAPYAVLFVALSGKLTPRTLAFATAVPGVLLLFNLPFIPLHIGHPMDIAESLVTWAAHIVILAFAVRAIRKNEIRPEGWDLAVAFAASFFYFLISYAMVPYLYNALR